MCRRITVKLAPLHPINGRMENAPIRRLPVARYVKLENQINAVGASSNKLVRFKAIVDAHVTGSLPLRPALKLL